MERMLSAYERAGKRDAFNALKSQYKAVLDDLNTYPLEMVKRRLDVVVSEEPIWVFFKKYYVKVAGVVGFTYLDNLVKQKSIEDDWINLFESDMDAWMRLHMAGRVTNITKRTEQLLRNILESGEENGLGIPEIAKDIRHSLTTMGRSRSLTIARTEITTASSVGADRAIRSTGIRTKKFWMNSGLDGVRESHQYAQQDSYANGGYNEDAPFSNGLQYAHDPNGAPEEVINCRCVTIYKPA